MMVPAPDLAEVAETWWDVDRVPAVVWDVEGRRFELVDPLEPGSHRLLLVVLDRPAADPDAVATVLAEGLAACDFPPTAGQASPDRVRRAFEAAGRRERPIE